MSIVDLPMPASDVPGGDGGAGTSEHGAVHDAVSAPARAQVRESRRPSATFPPEMVGQIQTMAESGRYEIRGWGAKRRVPSFDDLSFLTASASRYPLEGYRERCDTTTVLGSRYATNPLVLDIPITIAGMSFGSLSAHAKESLGRAATAVGTSTTTGDGGMTPEERKASKRLVYQCLPSRYGFNPADVHQADAIEVVIGQGAKPGGGGMLLGEKVSERVAGMRTLPPGVDQRSASRHPDWTGPDDLSIKIAELREATGWEKPIYVKLGATRVANDVKLAVAAGADVVVVDGMQGGTGATQEAFIEHAGIPTLAAVRLAVGRPARARQGAGGAAHRLGRHPHRGRRRQGARTGRERRRDRRRSARRAGLQPLHLRQGRPAARRDARLREAGRSARVLPPLPDRPLPHGRHHAGPGARVAARPGGRCPLGHQLPQGDDDGAHDPRAGVRQVSVHHLEPEDLVALTIEAAAMARVPLAGTSWIPGQSF